MRSPYTPNTGAFPCSVPAGCSHPPALARSSLGGGVGANTSSQLLAPPLPTMPHSKLREEREKERTDGQRRSLGDKSPYPREGTGRRAVSSA